MVSLPNVIDKTKQLIRRVHDAWTGNLPFAIYTISGGEGQTKAWNYVDYAIGGYKTNDIVYSCINEIQATVASIRLKVEYDGEIVEPDEIANPKVRTLAGLLYRPSRYQSQSEWLKLWTLFMSLGGISHIQGNGLGFVTGDNGEFKEPNSAPELQLIRPDRITIKYKDGRVSGILLDESIPILPIEKILWTAYPDPLNEFAGMSPIQAAELVIKTSNAGNRWNEAVMRNSGRIEGIVSVDASTMTPTQADEQRAKFQAIYGGASNVGKTLFLSRFAKYTKLANTPQELDWKGSEAILARKICNVLRVPSQLLGDPETSKYSNYKEARKAMYQDTSLPLVEHLVNELNWWLVPRFDITGKTRIITDTRHIEVLRDDENSLFNRLAQATWLTPNEKREASGYQPIDDEEADKLQITAPNPFAGIDSLSDGVEKEKRTEPDLLEHVDGKSKYKTQMSRDGYVEMRDGQRVPFVKQFIAVMGSYWKRQEAIVLARLDEVNTNPDAIKKHTLFDPDLFDTLEDENEKLATAIKPLKIGIVSKVARDVLNELGKSNLLVNIDRPDIMDWIADDIAVRSRLINRTTGRALRKIIQEANAEGVGAVETRYRIQEYFDDISKGRAIAIARTETLRAQSKGTMEAFNTADVEFVEWVSARDDRVRDSHQEPLDGYVVRMGDDFPVVNAPAPGLSADPGESINCRCALAPLESPEDAI